MFEAESPYFALCPWLLADEDMGSTGWPFDAWHGWAYEDKYGRQKPVIQILQQTAPNGGLTARQEIVKAQHHIDGADGSLDKALALLG